VETKATHIVKRSSQHEYYCSWSEYGGAEDECLVEHVESGDVVIQFNCPLPGEKQVKDVGHSRGSPAATLIEELVETFWCVSQGIGCSHILYTVTLETNRQICSRQINRYKVYKDAFL